VFHEDDATFSVVGDERELTILSTGLLASAIKAGDGRAALAVVTGAFAGMRVALICPELAEWAKGRLVEIAVSKRQRDLNAVVRTPAHAKSNLPGQVDAWLPAADFPKLAPMLKLAGQEIDALASALYSRTSGGLSAVIDEIHELREELEMLWWNVGGFSTQFSKPYASIPKPVIPILAGLELAALTRSKFGPAAIGALIQLKLKACKATGAFTVSGVIQESAATAVEVPDLADADMLSGLCPLLTAMHYRRTIGEGAAWNGAFKARTGIDANAEMPALDIAMQAYREVLLRRLGDQQ
jgi:hypothetical protein